MFYVTEATWPLVGGEALTARSCCGTAAEREREREREMYVCMYVCIYIYIYIHTYVYMHYLYGDLTIILPTNFQNLDLQNKHLISPTNSQNLDLQNKHRVSPLPKWSNALITLKTHRVTRVGPIRCFSLRIFF